MQSTQAGKTPNTTHQDSPAAAAFFLGGFDLSGPLPRWHRPTSVPVENAASPGNLYTPGILAMHSLLAAVSHPVSRLLLSHADGKSPACAPKQSKPATSCKSGRVKRRNAENQPPTASLLIQSRRDVRKAILFDMKFQPIDEIGIHV